MGTFAGAYLDVGPVDEVLVLAPDDHLPRDDHLVVLLVAQGGPAGQKEGQRYDTIVTVNRPNSVSKMPGHISCSITSQPVIKGKQNLKKDHMPKCPNRGHARWTHTFLSRLSKVMETEALVTPACPFLYTRAYIAGGYHKLVKGIVSTSSDLQFKIKSIVFLNSIKSKEPAGNTRKFRHLPIRTSHRRYYLKILRPDVREVRDTHEEADGVQNVALAGAVETGDGVEGRVEAIDLHPLAVRLEAVNHDRLDEHRGLLALTPPAGVILSARCKFNVNKLDEVD